MVVTRHADFAGFTVFRANRAYDIAIKTKFLSILNFVKSFYDIVDVFVVFFESAGGFGSN